MCCWFLIGWALAPRFALVMMWLLTDYISKAFGNILIPFIGFFLMPWTTLTYSLVAPGGLGMFDYVFLAIAVVADFSAYGGGYKYRRSAASS